MRKILVAVLVLAAAGLGRVIRVPGGQPTIQAGLDAAASGDTVLVAPGTYRERIVWPKRDGIRLLSEEGRAATTVDAESAGTVIAINDNPVPLITRATVIKGFTLTNGSNGGIRVSEGAPTIADNRITKCVSIGYGPAIFLNGNGGAFKPLVTGNEIDGNTVVETSSHCSGGGVYVSSASGGCRPEVCFNYIHDNTLRGTRNHGAGIYASGSTLIYGNVISDNAATAGTSSWCYGGGIYLTVSSARLVPVVFNNLIVKNRCESPTWSHGAGIYAACTSTLGDALVLNNTIVNNSCSGLWSFGGGLYNAGKAVLQNNIVASNGATDGSGIFNDATVTLSHNDYYDNNLLGCQPGPGDISDPPLFVTGHAGSFLLSQTAAGQPENSPCVDAGDALPPLPSGLERLIYEWTTRTDSAADAGMPDMGYHYPFSCPTGIAEQPVAPPRVVTTIAPNPLVGGFALLRIQGVKDSRNQVASVRVFDASGRCVLTRPFVIRHSEFALSLDLRKVPAGVYLVRFDADGYNVSQKLVAQRKDGEN